MLNELRSLPSLSVRFIPPMRLAYLRAHGPYTQSVSEAWRHMFAWLDSRGHIASTGRGYGLAHDDPKKTLSSRIRYDAGVQIPPTWDEIDETLVHVKTFSGGSYTMQHYVCPYDQIGRIISQTRRDVLPRNGLALDPSRPILCIHHSDPRFVAPEQHKTDVCLPVMMERRSVARDETAPSPTCAPRPPV